MADPPWHYDGTSVNPRKAQGKYHVFRELPYPTRRRHPMSPRKTRSDALPMPTMEWLRERSIVTDAGCWEWQGALKNGLYGKFARRRRFFQVHRHAWTLVKGPIPDGMFVCHRCDNPPCFNPAHLFLGTIIDNNRDAWSKGRGVNNPRRGEQHHNTHLTVEDVRAIRQIRAESGMEHREIGARFGISANAACKITRRRTWKEVA